LHRYARKCTVLACAGSRVDTFAQKIQKKPQVINEYEQGKTIPDNAVLGKMERALGVKLRGNIAGGAKKKK
jgi:ribosome-binding protein aMBF1 (putative translation factor)